MTKKIVSFVLAVLLAAGCSAAFADVTPDHSENKHSMYEQSASAKLSYTVSRVFEWTVPAEVEIEFTAKEDKSLSLQQKLEKGQVMPFGYVSVKNVILGKVDETNPKDMLITISYADRTDLNLYPITGYKKSDDTPVSLEEYEALTPEEKSACKSVYGTTAESTIKANDETNGYHWRLYSEVLTSKKGESAYDHANNALVQDSTYLYDIDKFSDKTLLVVRTNGAQKLMKLDVCADSDDHSVITPDFTQFTDTNNYVFTDEPIGEIKAEDLYYTNRGVPSKLGYHQGTVTYTCTCDAIDTISEFT